MKRTALLSVVLMTLSATPAFAHPGHDVQSGFLHPFTGADHLLAMLAVGAWGAMLGGRAIWALPASFMAAMIGGAFAAWAGITIPLTETVILASVVVLAAVLLLRLRMPAWSAMSLVAIFAVAHGYAHASEAAQGASLMIYGAGFVAATALLHALGAMAVVVARTRRAHA